MQQHKSPFKWRHFEPTIILLCVRWYCRYQISYRDPMLGFKNFRNAAVTVSGIELVQQIRKGQFDTTKLTGRVGGRVPQVWEAVLAA